MSSYAPYRDLRVVVGLGRWRECFDLNLRSEASYHGVVAQRLWLSSQGDHFLEEAFNGPNQALTVDRRSLGKCIDRTVESVKQHHGRPLLVITAKPPRTSP